MGIKKLFLLFFFAMLLFSAFAVTYNYLDSRLTGSSIRTMRVRDGLAMQRTVTIPEGLEPISAEDFLLAMEEEIRDLTDEEFREAIERDFFPGVALGETFWSDSTDLIFEREAISERIINILFLGDDARIYQDRGRSDTIILISYNRDTHVISLTSFMRDILIPSSHNGTYWNRINLMHALGGPGRTINHLNELFSLDIQRYAVVRFSGVFALVDALEGLELFLSAPEALMINRIFPDYHPLEPGINVLDGRQVLAYSRLRAIDNDLVRTQRQRNVLRGLLEKVLDSRNVGHIFTMAAFALDHVETNIPLHEIIRWGAEIFSGPRPEVEELRIPIDGSFGHALFNEAYILTIDFEENIMALHDGIYGNTEDLWIPEIVWPRLDPILSALPLD